MPRVHFVKRARKAHKNIGVKKGESYYWAQFKTGPYTSLRREWKERPRQSQLTMSDYLSAMYGYQEQVEDAQTGHDNTDPDLSGIADTLDEVASEMRSTGDEQQEKYDNLPENFQNGNTGETLQARKDACESLADELETAAGALRDWTLRDHDQALADEYEAWDTARSEAEEAAAKLNKEVKVEPFERVDDVAEAVSAAIDDAVSSISWEFS